MNTFKIHYTIFLMFKTEAAKVQTHLLKSLLSFIFLCFEWKSQSLYCIWNSLCNFHFTGSNVWYMYSHKKKFKNRFEQINIIFIAFNDDGTPETYPYIMDRGGNSCSRVGFVSCQVMSIRLHRSTLTRHVY